MPLLRELLLASIKTLRMLLIRTAKQKKAPDNPGASSRDAVKREKL
jgi:hypothetical protein